jgi:general secretion pathway protein E
MRENFAVTRTGPEGSGQGAYVPIDLGERLVAHGLLSPWQLRYILQKQKTEDLPLGKLLVRHGLVREYDIARELAESKGFVFVTRDEFLVPDEQLLSHFNSELCLSYGFLPLRRVGDDLEILLGEGDEKEISYIVRERMGLSCRFVQGEFSRVARYIREIYRFAQYSLDNLLEREVRLLSNDVDHAYSPGPFVDFLLHKAVRERTSDVHIVPSSWSMHIFFRIDGILRPIMALPHSLMRIATFIKLSAEMDISEQRRPQDGSFRATIFDQSFAIRVSILFVKFGEHIVLRLLPEQSELASLSQLGFLEQDVRKLERIFSKPSGMILVVGPTGSGKSTSMYAALQEIRSLVESNVLTVEDPIEYWIPGAAQTEVNRRADYDFDNALRYFLRHDPDVILIGEVRDHETARMAMEASATGHLVITSLHVANVFGVVSRLFSLGLDRRLIADNLIAIISQRLVRKNCPHCSEETHLSKAEEAWLGGGEIHARHGVGCDACGQSGYAGRLPVYEILEIDGALANCISDDGSREALRQLAKERDFKNLAWQAKWRVRHGQTTLDEVRRVVGVGVGDVIGVEAEDL